MEIRVPCTSLSALLIHLQELVIGSLRIFADPDVFPFPDKGSLSPLGGAREVCLYGLEHCSSRSKGVNVPVNDQETMEWLVQQSGEHADHL